MIGIRIEGKATPDDFEQLRELLEFIESKSRLQLVTSTVEVLTKSEEPDVLNTLIAETGLSEWPIICLERARISTLRQLVQKTEDDLLAITNFGQKSLDEVIPMLDGYGLALKIRTD